MSESNIDWQMISGIVQTLAIVLALVTLYLESRRTNRLSRREIYQRLELASAELFRFEVQEKDFIGILWDPKKLLPDRESSDYYALRSYVCNILNLFEMAVSFMVEGILPPDVFGSWVIWIFELASEPKFHTMWPELRLNYIGSLRLIVDEAVKISQTKMHKGRAYEDPRIAFYEFVADEFHSDSVRAYAQEAKIRATE